MAIHLLSEVHVMHVTAILRARVVEIVTQWLASVTASRASQAEPATSVGRDTQSLMASASVCVTLSDAIYQWYITDVATYDWELGHSQVK